MNLWQRIPSVIRNPFTLTFLVYLGWMFFLDANSIPAQISITQKLNRLQSEKEYYQEKIVEVRQDREELLSDPALLEKFAREKYLMRRPTEDVYVIQYRQD